MDLTDTLAAWRRRILLASLLLGVLAGVVLSLLQVRQGHLDRALLTAIYRNDTPSAIELLDEGANANAVAWVGPTAAPETLLSDLRLWLHGRHPDAKGFHAPALYLVYTRQFHPRSYSLVRMSAPAFAGRGGVQSYAVPENLPLVKALLKHGADPNFHPGRTGPLHMAVRMDHRETVRLLLEHHADPNAPDDSKSMPLMAAGPECAGLLIKYGPRVNGRGSHGLTPLMVAAADRGSSGAARVELLLHHGAEVNAQDDYGQTPLMHAFNVSAARLLLSSSADIDARTPAGMTALMMDCANYCDPDLPAFLARHGANVSFKDRHGKSALDYATERRNRRLHIGSGGTSVTFPRGDVGPDLVSLLKVAEANERKAAAVRFQTRDQAP